MMLCFWFLYYIYFYDRQNVTGHISLLSKRPKNAPRLSYSDISFSRETTLATSREEKTEKVDGCQYHRSTPRTTLTNKP